jgi:hypothetical protein
MDDKQFNKRFQGYLAGLRAMEKATDDLADKSERADKKRAKSAKKAEETIAKSLQQSRREMLTVLFFIRMLERAWVAAWRLMGDASEEGAKRMGIRALARRMETDLGGVAAQIVELANESSSAQEAMQVVLQGLLTDQGQFSDEYAKLWEAARVAAVTGMAEADEAFKAFVTDLVEGTGAATDAISPIYGVQQALADFAAESGRTVEQLTQQEAAHITLQQVYRTTNELLDEGARAALDASEGWDRVTAAIDEFKTVVGTLLVESGALPALKRLVDAATQSVALLGAAWSATREGFTTGNFELNVANALTELIQAGRGDPSEAFSKHMQRYADALGLFQDKVNKGGMDYAGLRAGADPSDPDDFSPILDHLMKRERLMEDHSYRIGKVEQRYQTRMAKAWSRYNTNVSRIQRQADRDRDRAQRRFDRQRARAQNDMQRRLEKAEQEHYLRLEQNSREYRLREMQSEALYQYERGRLVAFGDVLGIEDLDARSELEKDARKQNFDEQQRQEKENYELRRRFMREQMEEQMEWMRAALEDQLEEIRIREEERLREAEERRKEELADAAQARDAQLKDEERQHLRSLEQWNQYWVKLAGRFDLGLSEVRAILNTFFGSGGDIDSIMSSFISKWQGYMSQLIQLQQLMTNLRRGAAALPPSYPGASRRGGDWPYQYGGSGIFSRPTRLMVGEGHMPEMVSVRPMTSLSTVKLSWSGGPIPVSGNGLEGADTSSIGDSIAQGLMMSLEKALVRTGATYG